AARRLGRRSRRSPRELFPSRRMRPHAKHQDGYAALFNKENRRATIFASVPWFLQDLGTYGIGIFTPTILAASVGHKAAHIRNISDLISNDELAAKGAALID